MTTRRAFFGGIAAAAAAAAGTPEPADLAHKLIEFHKHYNSFFRSFFGCAKGATDVEQCDPRRGVPDYGEAIQAARCDPFPAMRRKTECAERPAEP